MDPEIGPLMEAVPVPIGRWAEPDEIAAAATWMLGGDSSFLLGAVLFVDGGTIGFMLSTLIGETPDLLVIDAVRMAEPPGRARCFEDDAMDRFLTGRCSSVHEIGLRDALDPKQR